MQTKTVDKAMSTLQALLEEKHAYETAIKQRCMIFQVGEKESIAKELGLPFNTFYHFAYNKWDMIRKEVQIVHQEAEKIYYNPKLRKTIPELNKLKYGKTTMGTIWSAYFDYCKRTDRDRRKEIISKYRLDLPTE